ncbi:MAG: Asp23/Gls24 family envelope stress response protein [Parachlamydiales bacterium]|nr:Asp23/Gls24 family envelope stress response protein [Parachlamydiales bacterium]
MYDQLKNMDARELELPETVFIRDIDTRVFQAIALQCLAKIEGIGLLEGNLFDSLLGREVERVKGIHVEQDQKNHSVEVKVEINIKYGFNIPSKAEEVQEKLVEEISKLTGLHVSSVHVIFKDLIAVSAEQPVQGEFEGAF